MHSWFGEQPWSSACTGLPRVTRPVGATCLHCTEPIGEADDGLITPVVRSMTGPPTLEPVHAECQLRSAVGSLAHLERRCSCYGGTDHETPGLSRRQEAIAVQNWIRWHGPA